VNETNIKYEAKNLTIWDIANSWKSHTKHDGHPHAAREPHCYIAGALNYGSWAKSHFVNDEKVIYLQ